MKIHDFFVEIGSKVVAPTFFSTVVLGDVVWHTSAPPNCRRAPWGSQSLDISGFWPNPPKSIDFAIKNTKYLENEAFPNCNFFYTFLVSYEVALCQIWASNSSRCFFSLWHRYLPLVFGWWIHLPQADWPGIAGKSGREFLIETYTSPLLALCNATALAYSTKSSPKEC